MQQEFLYPYRASIAISMFCMGIMLSVFLPGCKSTEFTSHWRTLPVQVDGRNEEWQNSLIRIEDKQAMIGFMNDGSDLYLALVTDDRALQRQIMFRGLTVWFDREGGNSKKFGIHFPMGVQFGGFMGSRQPREEETPDSSYRDRMPPVDTVQAEITGPAEGDHRLVTIAQLKQIAVKMSLTGGTLVYELKVPLTDNGPDPCAIGTEQGKTIGIGFETAARQTTGSDEDSGNPEGMSRRGFGRRGGGGERSAWMGQRTEPLSVWATVTLASSPAESHP